MWVPGVGSSYSSKTLCSFDDYAVGLKKLCKLASIVLMCYPEYSTPHLHKSRPSSAIAEYIYRLMSLHLSK